MDKAFNLGPIVAFPANLGQLINDDDSFPHIMVTHNNPEHNIQSMHFYVPESLLMDDSAAYEGLSTQMRVARDIVNSKNTDALSKSDQYAASQLMASKALGGAVDQFIALDNQKNKIALNPMMEMAFQSMGMRSFKLDLAMTPNNVDEAMSIIAIVNCFRELMYPEKTTTDSGDIGTGFTLKYPAMWRLQFMKGEEESFFMPSFYDAYLASMSTNYRAQSGAFIQIKNDNATDYIGQRIDITLGFSEAKQLTRNDIYASSRPVMGSDRGELPPHPGSKSESPGGA